MTSERLKKRTKKFAIDTIHLVDLSFSDKTTNILGKELIRAATSIGANYRAACRASSKADFISKITIVEVEADECQYWLELFSEIGESNSEPTQTLSKEAGERTAIFTSTEKLQNVNSN